MDIRVEDYNQLQVFHMLASFRKLSNNFFTKIMLLMIVASFMLWGVSDMVGQPNRADVAKVGDLTISADDYFTQFLQLHEIIISGNG